MNTREYCLVQTEELGTVLQMEVGALMVGRIKNHKKKYLLYNGEKKKECSSLAGLQSFF